MPGQDVTEITVVVDAIEYIGPAGHESPLFGVLVPHQIYQAETAFAAYLVTTHPEYWKRPVA